MRTRFIDSGPGHPVVFVDNLPHDLSNLCLQSQEEPAASPPAARKCHQNETSSSSSHLYPSVYVPVPSVEEAFQRASKQQQQQNKELRSPRSVVTDSESSSSRTMTVASMSKDRAPSFLIASSTSYPAPPARTTPRSYSHTHIPRRQEPEMPARNHSPTRFSPSRRSSVSLPHGRRTQPQSHHQHLHNHNRKQHKRSMSHPVVPARTTPRAYSYTAEMPARNISLSRSPPTSRRCSHSSTRTLRPCARRSG